MVMVFEGTPNKFSMDGYLHDNLLTAKRIIKKDWDMIFVLDGGEGSGKSVLAMQMAYFCDPTFDLSRVVFNPQEFRNAIINSKPFTSVVYDEAYTGLSSRATMSMINRTLVSMLAEIRQKNLFVFVVMPCYFDLDKYVALWRSRALIHVYTGNDFERGYLAFYNVDKKKDLYILGKKFYSYSQPKPNFIGRFPNFYIVDVEQYKKKKLDALTSRAGKVYDEAIRKEAEDRMFERLMDKNLEMNHAQRMAILGMPSSTYFLKLKKYQETDSLSDG